MRDYGKVSPQFWTGKSGKAMRGHIEAQIVALYLMTSPHANMIGVYHLPILYLAHETGLTIEGATKGLRQCVEGAFCTYDDASETVFVVEMAAHQVGEALKPSDNRTGNIAKQYLAISESCVRAAFHARYADAFHLPKQVENTRHLEAPTKPLPSQKQEQEQKQEQDLDSLRSSSSAATPADPPVDIGAKKAERLAQVTDEAITAYNATLTAPHGVLPVVTKAGREKRQAEVKRCLRVVRRICAEQYQSPTVTPEFWKSYFTEVARDDFKSGRQQPGRGHENWKPGFEYLTREATVLEVFERAMSEAG